MTHNAAQLHRQGSERFRRAENGYRLVLIHTAVALGCSLLMALINYLFSLQIAETGGLGGMGLRTILTTAQTVLQTGVMLALPFWEIGIIYAALQWTRGKQTDTVSLLQGFRRLGPVLGFRILYAVILMMLGIGVFNVAYMLFFMLPQSSQVLERMKPLMDPAATAEQIESLMTPEAMTAMAKEMAPLLVIFSILFIPVAAAVFYRLRFGEFFVMDGVRAGSSLTASLSITRKKVWQLVKLDLHFWWYYLLQLLCVAVCFADSVAAILGVTLPVSGVAAYFIAYIVGTLLQGILLWRCRGQVLCTYCAAFDELTGRSSEEIA